MGDEAEHPRIRALDVFPVEQDGERLICLRDPIGLSDVVLSVGVPVLFVVSLLDGTRSLLDLQAEFARKYGQVLPREDLEGVLRRLDEALFLDNERFRSRLERVTEEFRRDPVRRAAHAGEAYPATPEECGRVLAGYFTAPGGPGAPGAPGAQRPLKGLIAPHIDPRRGGICYALAYHALAAAAEPPELAVVFGTSHQPMRERFCVTRKAYDTPFGALEGDAECIDLLEERLGGAIFRDELNHKTEHSIEFQALFIRYLYRDGPPPRILPVLCGSLQDCMVRGISPRDDTGFRAFLGGLRETLDRLGRRMILVAGADLAHVGMRFGASRPPDGAELRRIEAADRESLGILESLSGDRFFRYIAGESDERNVCGVSAIAAMMEVLDGTAGELLRYEQSVEEESGSVVTYASMAFFG